MAFLFLLLCMTMFLQLVVYLVGVRNDVTYKQHTSPLFLRPFWLSISTVNVFQRDSRINITTFFNFPGMFRRYIRHLQCYIFWNRRRIYIKRARSYKVGYIALSILRTKTTTKKIKWVTLSSYRERVRLMCFTCWLRSALSFTWYLVTAESKISKQSGVQDGST